MSIPGMEDAHAAVLDLAGAAESNAFFAVYDGHGGMYALQINDSIMLIGSRSLDFKICWRKPTQASRRRTSISREAI